jgi:hypothetical protein
MTHKIPRPNTSALVMLLMLLPSARKAGFLILPMARNYNIQWCIVCSGMMFITCFIKLRKLVQNILVDKDMIPSQYLSKKINVGLKVI